MKWLLLACFCAFFADTSSAIDSSTAPSKKPPYIGMTMASAHDYYGEPFHRVTVSGREEWFYYLKFSEVYGRAWVPFKFDSDNVNLGSITFGPDGKVASIDWRRVDIH